MSVLFAVLLFSLLIFVHELGHFVAAKTFGVQVNEFSMFMGPVLWKKQKGETLYSLRLIPIGGFCAMEGEDGDSDNPRAFTQAAWWKRVIILVAGAAVNFVVGVLLLLLCFAPDQQFNVPVVASIEEGCLIAGENGIQQGDRILDIDGTHIYNFQAVSMILSLNGGEYHDVTLQRGNQKVVLKNFHMEKNYFPEADGSQSYRYGFSFGQEPASFGALVRYTWNYAMFSVQNVGLSLKMLVSGRAGLQDVSGPVGIVQQMSDVVEQSGSAYYAMLNMLLFGGFIAINLAVMNLLPIPALDGGRTVGVLLTAAAEGITRKKIDPKYEGYIHGAGMVLLLGLMGLIMFKDIFVIVRG